MTARRHPRLAAALLALPLLLTACAGETAEVSSPTSAPVPSTAAPTSAAPSAAPSVAPTPSAAADDATAVTLAVAGGKVTGDTGRAAVGLGDTVRMTVTSDVADEIHVHGYDLYVDTTPGQPAQVEFVADQPGVFEVEFHDSGLLLTRLQVQ